MNDARIHLVVLISGDGSNLQAILDNSANGTLQDDQNAAPCVMVV